MSELPPDLGADERALADRLQSERPVPAAGFRGTLGRRLRSKDPGYGPRPAWLRSMAGAYIGAGATLIALGTLISTGAI